MVDTKSTKKEKSTRTAAAVTLCKLNIKDDETFSTSTEWQHRNVTPLLMRLMILPEKIGHEYTDNNHGEVQAITMALNLIPKGHPLLGYRVLSLRVESMTIWETNPTVIKMGTTHPKMAQNPIVADTEAIPTYQ